MDKKAIDLSGTPELTDEELKRAKKFHPPCPWPKCKGRMVGHEFHNLVIYNCSICDYRITDDP